MSKVLWILVVVCTVLSCSNSENDLVITGRHYIAHAGGSIDGYTYTNSKEAVEHAIACGITFIELDLGITSDGYLVAIHDWGWFNEISTGVYDTTSISLDEFRGRKIFDKYTPLTFHEIDSIWKANPSLILVTDKISDPIIIDKYFNWMKKRVVVECFKESDYLVLKEMGYLETMLSQCPPVLEAGVEPTYYNGYCFWHGETPELPSCIGENTSGDLYAIFSYDDRKSADAIFALDDRIKLIYIDNVEPY